MEKPITSSEDVNGESSRLRQLRSRTGPVSRVLYFPVIWLGIGLVVVAVGWVSLLSMLSAERRQAENSALIEAGILARGYAGHLARTLDTIDQLLMVLKLQWENSAGNVQLEDYKMRGAFPEEAPFNVSIVSADGIRLTSTFGHNVDRASLDVSDRPYYLAHKTAPRDFLFMGLPTWGRATGNAVIQFSRRLTLPSGAFAGVVLLTVKLEFLTANYDTVTLGKHGFIGAVGVDGLVRMARTGTTVYDPATNPIPAAPDFATMAGSRYFPPNTMFQDGRSRYVGWQRLPGYDLIALTALDEQTFMAPYGQRRAGLIKTAVTLTFAVLLLSCAAALVALRLAARKRQLEMAQSTYRIATEAGSEGFYIARPVVDEAGRVVDFEALDCNRRGAALFELRQEEFIGTKLSYLHDPVSFHRAYRALLHAINNGEFEGELDLTSKDESLHHCVYLKAVYAEGNLAITMRDISKEKSHVRELERRSNEDVLTGLPNRLWVQSFLPDAVAQTSRSGKKLGVLFIDLDGFKKVNDTMGHAAGDEVLRIAALRLKDAVRPHDKVVRLGGDEFLVIVENIVVDEDAAHVAERVLQGFNKGFRLQEGTASIGTSIGISIYPGDATDAGSLLEHADIAMYSAKTAGKRTYRFFDASFLDALRTRLHRENELRHGIERDQFILHYQPRIELLTGKTSSLEALVRWVHPSEGLLTPIDFIDLAEESGLVVQLGELVIEKVCAQIANWTEQGEYVVPVSVNVSSRQFNEANISKIFQRTISRHGIDPRLVEVELTEAAMMEDSEEVTTALCDMRDQGMALLVDDFGTGYSSLAKLQQLDFDVLKVDRAFTTQLGKTDQGNVFFEAIITMAHALGMRVVAEGVEKKEQLTILRHLGCDEIQGFLVAKPLAPTANQADLFRKIVAMPT